MVEELVSASITIVIMLEEKVLKPQLTMCVCMSRGQRHWHKVGSFTCPMNGLPWIFTALDGELHISHERSPMDIHSIGTQFQCMSLSHLSQTSPFLPVHMCVQVIFKHMMGILPRSLWFAPYELWSYLKRLWFLTEWQARYDWCMVLLTHLEIFF